MLRRWVVNLGALTGVQRIAHLFCELSARLDSIGMVKAGGFEMPLTQAVLAETCGLSSVHMNRVLQHLRGEHLIQLDRRRLTILDEPRLQTVAGFRPDYLKLRTA
jgi:CRP-like cAMP-binding protein